MHPKGAIQHKWTHRKTQLTWRECLRCLEPFSVVWDCSSIKSFRSLETETVSDLKLSKHKLIASRTVPHTGKIKLIASEFQSSYVRANKLVVINNIKVDVIRWSKRRKRRVGFLTFSGMQELLKRKVDGSV